MSEQCSCSRTAALGALYQLWRGKCGEEVPCVRQEQEAAYLPQAPCVIFPVGLFQRWLPQELLGLLERCRSELSNLST